MQIDLLFPVPVWKKQLNFDNNTIKDIKNLCIEMSNNISGRVVSNLGGYQSPDISKSLYKKYPFDIICNHINESIFFLEEHLNIDKRAGLKLGNMWINKNLKGDSNTTHSHPRGVFSGIIYISCCDENHGVVFENPHPIEQHYLHCISTVETNLSSRKYKVSSQPGMMYMFPSWLFHHVPEYEGTDERITIAFNIQ